MNGRELTKDSRVKDLQDGCNFLGINASGSKSKLYDRLCSYVTKQFQKDVDRSRTNLQKLELGPEPVLQKKGMEKPTDPRAIERHEATHLPFAPWCNACLKTKSKEDHTLSNTDGAVESSGIPHIQMDWMYLGRNCPSLVLLDTMTRFGAIFPARTKGAWRALAEFCVKFSLGLNHLGEVVYVMDSEPATLGLLDMIVMIRQDMGYKTSKKVGKPYHKGRTARVERYIQTIRRQSNTLFAGSVDVVDRPHGDVCWEDDIDWELVESEMNEMEVDFHGERPPEVSAAELKQLDGDAMKTEIQKLTDLGVVKVLTRQQMDQNGKWIDLKEVFDWRFRQGSWRRRCRIVAREFRTGPSTEETFSFCVTFFKVGSWQV